MKLIYRLLLFISFSSISTTYSQNISGGKAIKSIGLSYKEIRAFDADNDGDMDILSFPLLLFNNGLGQREYSQNLYAKDFDFEDLKVSDLDNNGYTDIVVLLKTGDILVFANSSEGFKMIQQKDLDYRPVDYAKINLFDVNSDGIIDIVINGLINSSYYAWIGTKELKYSFNQKFLHQFENALRVLGQDINNDGIQEVLFMPRQTSKNQLNQLYVYNYSDNNYQLKDSILVGTRYIDNYVFQDINSDGKIDFVYCSERGDGRIFCNLSTQKGYLGNFNELFVSQTPIEKEISKITLGDFDNDKDLDIVLLLEGNGPQEIMWITQNQKDKYSVSKDTSLPKSTLANTFMCTDFNGDKLYDLALYINAGYQKLNRFEFLLATGNSNKYSNKNWITDTKTSGFAFADMNNDGFDDIVKFYESTIFCSLIDSVGNFGNYINLASTPFKINNFEITKIDSDDKLDIIISSDDRANGKVGWLKNMGSLRFDEYLGIHENIGRVIDFKSIHLNAKHEADILVNYWEKTKKGIYIYDNIGNGEFNKNARKILERDKFTHLDLIDINFDQKLDIVDFHTNTYYSIKDNFDWEMNTLKLPSDHYRYGMFPITSGNSGSAKGLLAPTFRNIKILEYNNEKWKEDTLLKQNNMKSLAVGDINLDGYDDIVCVTSETEIGISSFGFADITMHDVYSLSICLSNSDGSLTLQKLYPIKYQSEILLHDFDKDGDLDIFTCSQHWPTSGITLWKNEAVSQ